MEPDNVLNVQNGFFNQIRKERARVTISLSNGQRISGIVKSFDKFTLLVETRNGEQMIFKHAVSTIALLRPPEAGQGAEPKDRERGAGERRGFGNFIEFEGKKG